MDLAYLSDAFSHMSMRGASYSRYDQDWGWGRGWASEDSGITGGCVVWCVVCGVCDGQSGLRRPKGGLQKGAV